MITLERVCEITSHTQVPVYSPWGYIITPDGVTYALLHQWWHGAVLALLYPEELAKFRLKDDWDEDEEKVEGKALEMPDDPADLNVFDFQKFEFFVHDRLNVVRICSVRMIGLPSVDLPENGCTPEQREALRKALINAMGLSLQDEVATDHRDMSVKQCLHHADTGTSVWKS